MTFSIVACGESAKDWIPNGTSIGVNDAFKFGKKLDYLVVVNSPVKFYPSSKNGMIDRLKTITATKPDRFFCHQSNWIGYFPNYELIHMRNFVGTYRKGKIYSSKTSPFVAITLAASLGATEIIIWGVDMLNHHKFSPGKRDFDIELGYYRLLFEQLEQNGIRCFIGNENTIFKRILPVWQADIVLK